jgi:hypothetical protein
VCVKHEQYGGGLIDEVVHRAVVEPPQLFLLLSTPVRCLLQPHSGTTRCTSDVRAKRRSAQTISSSPTLCRASCGGDWIGGQDAGMDVRTTCPTYFVTRQVRCIQILFEGYIWRDVSKNERIWRVSLGILMQYERNASGHKSNVCVRIFSHTCLSRLLQLSPHLSWYLRVVHRYFINTLISTVFLDSSS